MGSATTHALGSAVAALDSASAVTLETSRELFAAARALGETPPLAGALADAAAPVEARTAVVAKAFGSLSATSRGLLDSAVQERWSSPSDLVDAIEELAIRAASKAEPGADVEGELFQVARVVADNPDLELALGSRLGVAAKKGELVEALLAGKAGAATTLIASSVIQQPRERRVRALLSRALRIVAGERGKTVATVSSAQPLTGEQRTRLTETLTRRYGTAISLNVVVDPEVVGGIRVEVGDDVIDATISSRLADLRHKLAG